MSVVKSMFGRTDEDIVAQPGDYAASQIANDTSIPASGLASAIKTLEDLLATKFWKLYKPDSYGGGITGDQYEPTVNAGPDRMPEQGAQLSVRKTSYSGYYDDSYGYTEEREGNGWGILYDVDLRLEAERSGLAAGSHTIGGVQWWLKGSNAAVPGTISGGIVPMQGLALSATPTTIDFDPSVAGSIIYLSWWLPFVQIAKYRDDLPLMVQFHIGYDLDQGDPPTSYPPVPIGGISSVANTSAAVAAEERPFEALVYATGQARSWKYGASACSPAWSRQSDIGGWGGSSDCHGFLLAPRATIPLKQEWGQRFDLGVGMRHAGGFFVSPARTNTGFLFTIKTQNVGRTGTVYLRALRILQSGLNA